MLSSPSTPQPLELTVWRGAWRRCRLTRWTRGEPVSLLGSGDWLPASPAPNWAQSRWRRSQHNIHICWHGKRSTWGPTTQNPSSHSDSKNNFGSLCQSHPAPPRPLYSPPPLLHSSRQMARVTLNPCIGCLEEHSSQKRNGVLTGPEQTRVLENNFAPEISTVEREV